MLSVSKISATTCTARREFQLIISTIDPTELRAIDVTLHLFTTNKCDKGYTKCSWYRHTLYPSRIYFCNVAFISETDTGALYGGVYLYDVKIREIPKTAGGG